MPNTPDHPPTPVATPPSPPAAASKKKKKPKKGQKKLKKAPGAPRRFKTAFIFFSTHKHKEIRQQLGPEKGKEKTTTIAKMVSEAWKNISQEERTVWDDIAAKDKARYQLEKQMYKGPWQVPDDGRDPMAPRRPCSAFIAFLNCKRDEVKRANPGVSSNDLMRIAAKLWRESPERDSYLAQEAKNLEKYKKDTKEWQEEQKMKPEALLASKREKMAWMTLEANEKSKGEQDRDRDDEQDDKTSQKLPASPRKKRGPRQIKSPASKNRPKLNRHHVDREGGASSCDEETSTNSSSRIATFQRKPSSASAMGLSRSSTRGPRPDLHTSVSNPGALGGPRTTAVDLGREEHMLLDGSGIPTARQNNPLRAARALDVHATHRIRQAFALQRESLVRRLHQPSLPAALVGGAGGSLMDDPVIMGDPVNLELARLLQRRRDECDLLV
eukprot:CAMPEP_0194025798 /NCGR_PEP_ID=MMETSP0009_2-20130614/51_1 /TAXON_ID=210454 /ORGANISM="Grammatophora oceanica, Strain CCMP 410" /LENGTH=440 /DNA_ID=CAMNT_0038664107 /DNA_START=287 /DNA_END=1605 /DNA_ORIENTATION=-